MYLEEVIRIILGISVVQEELQATVDGVEEPIYHHLIYIVYICLPDVWRLVCLEQLQIFLKIWTVYLFEMISTNINFDTEWL